MRTHFITMLAGLGLAVPIAGMAEGGEVPAAVSVPSRPDWVSRGCQTGPVGTAGDVNGDGYDDAIVGGRGEACVYHGSVQGLSHRPDWIAKETFSEFGTAAGTAGDVNGDGYDDVVVGARSYGEDDNGRVYAYYGSATGLSKEPDWMADADNRYAYFGTAVGAAGDVDGDGYDDVIIGAPNDGQAELGRAFVYRGSPSGLQARPAWFAWGPEYEASFGIAVGTAGDVNGDGYADIVVGASHAQTAFVYHGSASGLPKRADWTAEGDCTAGFGVSVGTAGDVNGDGYDEVIIGTHNHDHRLLERACLYRGSAAGLGTDPAWTFESGQGYAGNEVGTAGDINGDGFDDIMVNAPYSDYHLPDIGEVYGFYGSASGPGLSADWILRGNQSDAWLGTYLGTVGDANGDGRSDVIVGARFYTGAYYHLGAQP